MCGHYNTHYQTLFLKHSIQLTTAINLGKEMVEVGGRQQRIVLDLPVDEEKEGEDDPDPDKEEEEHPVQEKNDP